MSLTVLRPLAAAAALTLLLAGCGSDDTATPAAGTSGAPDAPDAQGAQGGQAGPAGMPGTNGQIVAVDGDVLQVRGQDSGQTAVTVTDATQVTDQVAGTLADVTTGVCVMVRATDGGTSTEQVTAASVSVTAAEDDGCAGPGGAGGPGGMGGERPSGMPSGMPTDMPTDRPSGVPEGGPGGGMGGGMGAFGQVTSVTDSGFVVEARDTEITVTVTGDTTYTHQVAADRTALTKDRCVRVQGDADDTGAVAATAIQVSDAVEGRCGR